MGREIFRKKIDTLSESEYLHHYIRVANPSAWLILAASLLFLIGMFGWALFGRVETVIESVGICQNGQLSCYVREEEKEKFSEEISLRVEGQVLEHIEISSEPMKVTDRQDSYMMYVGTLEEGDWVYELKTSCSMPDGVYKVNIIAERIAPLRFVWN